MSEIIKLKGIKNGIMMIIDGGADYDQIINFIPSKIKEVNDFLKEESNIVISGKVFSGTERISIEQKIAQAVSANVNITYDSEDFDTLSVTKAGAGKIGIETTMYRGTLRSGQCVRSNGNLVVVGDINPGAELIAVGDIVVMGVLRGIVHAGCSGDKNAIISAVKMQPTQIRIADIITRPPDGEFDDVWIPEVAYIKDGNIYIDDYLSKNFK